MLRKTVNASRLQEECARRLQRMQAIQEDGVKIQVPRPSLRAPDGGGCNWEMPEFGNAVGFKREIAAVLEAMRREFNLVADAPDETEPRAERLGGIDPFAATGNPAEDARRAASTGPTRQDPFGGSAGSTPRKTSDPFAPAVDE